jgi:thiamine kinase-like enzyme
MTVNQPELATVQCIIAHPSEPKFMAVKHKGGYLPPQVQVPMDAELGPNIASLTAAVEKKYGLKTTALRLVARQPKFQCLELELHGRDSRRLKAVWVGPDDYARIHGGNPGTTDPFARWLDQRSRGIVPPERPPWELPGWFSRARHWIDIELDRLNIQPTGSVRQVRALSHSATLLRVPTSAGNLFFKASYDKPPREAQLTQFLSESWPGRVTELLAVDLSMNWMLMREPNLEQQPANQTERYARAAAALASLQIDSLKTLGELKLLGCKMTGVEQLKRFLVDGSLPRAISLLDTDRLSQQAREELAVLAPQFGDLCEKLVGYGVPDMLIHTDFQSRNFFVGTNDVQIIDWQRACIGHPFFSLLTLARIDIDWELDGLNEDPIIRSYLTHFVDFDSMNRLQEAMHLVCRLYLVWRLWYRMRELPYYEPGSAALFRAHGVIAEVVKRLLETDRNVPLKILTD